MKLSNSQYLWIVTLILLILKADTVGIQSFLQPSTQQRSPAVNQDEGKAQNSASQDYVRLFIYRSRKHAFL